MANSRNSAPAEAGQSNVRGAVSRAPREAETEPVIAAVSAALDEFVACGARLAVALSGGLDSMVLLDALARVVADRVADRAIHLSAIHVDHGISVQSRDWARFCADQCAARGIALVTYRLALPVKHGANLEAVARRERYACLRAAEAGVVALAHHADDQAETVLLQLMRGAGPRGLAAMPRFQPGVPAMLRPFLGLRRATLEDYARRAGLPWVDDASNTDVRHRRNLVRRDIAPRLAEAFPGYPETLQRSAENQAEASELLDVLAQHDAGPAGAAGGVDCATLAALNPVRARNVLRWFLRAHALRMPSRARLDEMLRQLTAARADAHTLVALDGVEIGVHRGRVRVHSQPTPRYVCAWDGQGEIALPGGEVRFTPTVGAGFRQDARGVFTLRSRSGGERLQLAANRPRRALKKLLQDAGLPPWERNALPLLWYGDSLVAVPGIGVDLAFQSRNGEPGWTLVWCPSAPPGSRGGKSD